MFCFLEDNKIISAIENAITQSDWKKNRFSTHSRLLEVVDRVATFVDRSKTYGLSSTLYMSGLSIELSP
jgi:hypothetical protein